ncbi:hypothetical protein LV28_19620 [Pandoraea pnomenusa]|uniref:Type III secretion apparatus protein, YscI/HrpB, C-terminal domain n=1 Tax=Pandoraea pnomenusa TaxID=93220 RepID=A0A378YW51_9BURK|nr:type III secretion system inner rod subunit SctI [Pandoraea pnomenusa]AIU28478.1 hypothetical protein LV28_19620 [Pandoraea pnomenusa]SUA80679.1 type III secretion apparatus protein, YscI/HrpB, C-terminal domain [Pandoraea pnomenusa]
MTSAISAITATSAEPVAAAALPTAPADGAAVLQFRSALSQPDVSAPAPVDAARNAATVSAAGNTPSVFGDRVLAGLQSVSDSFRHQNATLTALSTYPGLSMTGVLQLQADIARFSLQVEMLGKITGKAPQQLDQLLRMQ